jgi:two-component system chemotaxis response regulator CheB
MPIGFTSGLATRLNGASKLTVCEASEGLTLEPGMAVIAKAGAHLVLERSSKAVAVCRLTKEPLGMHRPSVDVLFQSAARSFGSQVLACVLTGMGDDGLIGARAIRAAGGQILTEAKSTCVVHGMPRCVLEAGLSDADVPRQRLAEELVCRL